MKLVATHKTIKTAAACEIYGGYEVRQMGLIFKELKTRLAYELGANEEDLDFKVIK